MDIQNLFKKKFVMLDANDTSIKEKDNMFDNVIDNKNGVTKELSAIYNN